MLLTSTNLTQCTLKAKRFLELATYLWKFLTLLWELKNFIRKWWRGHDTPDFGHSITRGTMQRMLQVAQVQGQPLSSYYRFDYSNMESLWWCIARYWFSYYSYGRCYYLENRQKLNVEIVIIFSREFWTFFSLKYPPKDFALQVLYSYCENERWGTCKISKN